MKTETPEQAAARKAADAKRKRDERARKKTEAATQATQDQLARAETLEQFWAASITKADPAQLAEWRARQEYVEAVLGDIRTVLEGRTPDFEFIEDVDEEVRADIKEHGIAGVTAPLLIGRFWKEPETLGKLTSGADTPSTIFAKFGILTAVDDYSLHRWDSFVAAYRREKQPRIEIPEALYVSIKCSLCDAPPKVVSSAIAEAYKHQAKDFVCANCAAKAAKARTFTEVRGAEHALFDNWGRVKDRT
jgi:hypothetical protein